MDEAGAGPGQGQGVVHDVREALLHEPVVDVVELHREVVYQPRVLARPEQPPHLFRGSGVQGAGGWDTRLAADIALPSVGHMPRMECVRRTKPQPSLSLQK